MRLGELMRPRDRGVVPPEVERELEALDTALRGERMPPGTEGLEALVSDLRAEREEPDPRFEAELDAWVAAGFPRGERPGVRADGAGGSGGKPDGFFARFGPNGPRGWSPLVATTATLVVIGVSIAQVDFGGDGGQPTLGIQAEDGGGVTAEPAQAPRDESLAEDPDGAIDTGEIASGGSEGSYEFDTRDEGINALAEPQGGSRNRSGVNRGQETRRVERDAELTLAAPADEVPDVTNEAIDVVESANGVVLNSRVTGTDDSARAELELKVPAAELDSTLAALSDLADVQSRTEAAQDITRQYVSAKDRLVGLRAERDNLAARIREATTDAEVDALKAQLAAVNRQIAGAENELNEVKTRAQLADLHVVITSDGARSGGDGEGDWSLDDALRDAGRVLEVAAGIVLISAAVLLPLALIAAIGYVTVAAVNRRARERALDE